MCPTSGNGLFLPTTGRILTTTVHSAYKGDVILRSDDGGRSYNYRTGLLTPGVDEGQLAPLMEMVQSLQEKTEEQTRENARLELLLSQQQLLDNLDIQLIHLMHEPKDHIDLLILHQILPYLN